MSQPITYRCHPIFLLLFTNVPAWTASTLSAGVCHAGDLLHVQVINNTVIDAIYVPGVADPSITVYAGTPNPNATTPVNTNVQVEGNLVIRGAVSASSHHLSLVV